ncbi:MAG: DNA primase [Verrucomicrobiota bacterium]
MAFFSPATLEQVRAASDIVDVIGAVLPLKRAGANFLALCPFHKEKTPSFNINPHRQIFHCFGCHKGGDVFGFIMAYENLDFPEAVRRLAERAKIPLEVEREGSGETRQIKETLLQIHEQIAVRWQSALQNDAAGEIARAYLKKRGVSAEAVKLFRLGFAPESWDDTVNWAVSKGFDLKTVEQAGLIIGKENPAGGIRYYDRFRGRLIFPICDEQGRVIGFSGRILSGDEKAAKYVNSPETPIFTKGKVFFGLDKSKRAILDAGFAVICEGQLDLIACYMAGVQNVVAPQGTAFTADHARILRRYVEEVVLCFDSDAAGQDAAVRVLDSLLASGLAIRVAVVPAPDDPDSYIKQFGGAAFKEVIDRAEGFFDYYLKRLCATHDTRTDKGRLTVLNRMAEAVHKTGNVVLADTYAQKTALRLGVSPDSARIEFKKAAARPQPASREQGDAMTEPESSAAERPSTQEFWLLKLLFLRDVNWDWITAHLDPAWIVHGATRNIVTLALRHSAQQEIAPGPLLVELKESAEASLLTEALAENRPIPNPMQQLQDLVLKLRNLAIDRQLMELLQRASHPDTSDTERLKLLQQQQILRTRKKSPLQPLAAGQLQPSQA